MNHYAQINQDGVCIAELQTTGEIDAPHMIPVTGEGYLGKYWNGTAFEDVPVVTPTNWNIYVGPFFDRFGAEKWNILASTDLVVQALIKDCSVRKCINLQRPDLAQALDILIAKGFAIDKTAILTTPPTAEEAYP